jgi:hypothetical protein
VLQWFYSGVAVVSAGKRDVPIGNPAFQEHLLAFQALCGTCANDDCNDDENNVDDNDHEDEDDYSDAMMMVTVKAMQGGKGRTRFPSPFS